MCHFLYHIDPHIESDRIQEENSGKTFDQEKRKKKLRQWYPAMVPWPSVNLKLLASEVLFAEMPVNKVCQGIVQSCRFISLTSQFDVVFSCRSTLTISTFSKENHY